MLTLDPRKPAGGIDQPFRVRYFDDAMDEDLWAILAASFPLESDMHSLNAVGSKNSLCDRDDEFAAYVDLHPEWKLFHGWLGKNFPRLCADVFGLKPGGKRSVRFEFSSLPGDGGEVKPHPDTAKKLATAVMYFEPAWDQSWGGAFEALRHKTEPNADYTDRRPLWEEVETILTVPIVPRRIGFMLRSHNSLHGVRAIHAPHPRRTITVNLIGRV